MQHQFIPAKSPFYLPCLYYDGYYGTSRPKPPCFVTPGMKGMQCKLFLVSTANQNKNSCIFILPIEMVRWVLQKKVSRTFASWTSTWIYMTFLILLLLFNTSKLTSIKWMRVEIYFQLCLSIEFLNNSGIITAHLLFNY